MGFQVWEEDGEAQDGLFGDLLFMEGTRKLMKKRELGGHPCLPRDPVSGMTPLGAIGGSLSSPANPDWTPASLDLEGKQGPSLQELTTGLGEKNQLQEQVIRHAGNRTGSSINEADTDAQGSCGESFSMGQATGPSCRKQELISKGREMERHNFNEGVGKGTKEQGFPTCVRLIHQQRRAQRLVSSRMGKEEEVRPGVKSQPRVTSERAALNTAQVVQLGCWP